MTACQPEGSGHETSTTDTTAAGPTTTYQTSSATDPSITSESTSTLDSTDTGVALCNSENNSNECPPNTPICSNDGHCIRCDDTAFFKSVADQHEACQTQHPSTPACSEQGICVECTSEILTACEGTQTPICTASNACGCNSHYGQCGESGCNLFVSTCLPEGSVVEVGPKREYSTLADAVASFGKEAQGTIVVHESPGSDYYESVSVTEGRTLAFITVNGEEKPRWISPGPSESAILNVEAASTVFLDGIQIANHTPPPMPRGPCAGRGICVTSGSLWIDHSEIILNHGGGILLQAANAVFRTSFIGGGNANDVPAIEVVNSTVTEITYSTVGAGLGESHAISCTEGTVIARNSLIMTRGEPPAIEASCDIVLDMTNIGETDIPDPLSIFSSFNYNIGNFRLPEDTSLPTVGIWQDGDPLTDIDGATRPHRDGMEDYPGADLPGSSP